MKLRFSKLRLLCVIAICSYSCFIELSLAQDLSSKTRGQCALTLSVADWPPYEYINAKGQPKGIQIDLIKTIAEKVDCHLSYKSMPYGLALEAIRKGEVDLLMNATPTKERQIYGHFSIPYRKEFLLLYATETYHEKCKSLSLEELIKDGFQLGLQRGLVFGKKIEKIQKDPLLSQKIRYFDEDVQHVEFVKKHHLDGIVDDPVVVSYRTATIAKGRILKACPIVVSTTDISFLFSKKTISNDIVSRFNVAIEEIMQTREYQKKWIW